MVHRCRAPIPCFEALMDTSDSRRPMLSCASTASGSPSFQAPKSWVEQAYPDLIHYNKLDKGGHFAAWEQPGRNLEGLMSTCRPPLGGRLSTWRRLMSIYGMWLS